MLTPYYVYKINVLGVEDDLMKIMIDLGFGEYSTRFLRVKRVVMPQYYVEMWSDQVRAYGPSEFAQNSTKAISSVINSTRYYPETDEYDVDVHLRREDQSVIMAQGTILAHAKLCKN